MSTISAGLIAKALPCAPLWIAQQSGLFDERGLEVTYRLLGSGDAVTDAVKSDEVQFGLTTPEGALGDAAHSGRLRILASLTNQLPFHLIGARHRDTIESLKDGRIGVSSMTEGTVHVIQGMLAEHGLTYPEDYRLDVVGTHVDRWDLLQSGEIDAGLQIAPWDRLAIQEGFPDLGAPSDVYPEWAFLVVVADNDWCDAHQDETRAFLDALHSAASMIFDDRGTATDIVAAEINMDRALVRAALDDLTAGMMRRDLRLTPDALTSVVKGMASGDNDEDEDLNQAAHAVRNESYLPTGK